MNPTHAAPNAIAAIAHAATTRVAVTRVDAFRSGPHSEAVPL